MGIFVNCKKCGERIELVFNRNHKRVPLNIKPSVVTDNNTRILKRMRVSHFVTCCKDKNKQIINNKEKIN